MNSFIKTNNSDRNKTIIKYSVAGVIMNLGLAVFKIIAGKAVNSHAILLDGINSLADSISSMLTIVSTAVAGNKVDKEHPLGYGRLEYIGSMAVTVVVLYLGAISMIGAVKGIINHNPAPRFNTAAMIIMIISLVCKIVYGAVMRRKGLLLDSAAMIMTGADSIADAMISVGIILTIIIYKATGVSIEHYVCIVISLAIIWTGINMIRDCSDKIIGTRTDPELKRELIRTMVANDEVLNVSNLVIHNYGENVNIGSMVIDVDEDMRAGELTRLSRRLTDQAAEMGVAITSVGINGVNTDDRDLEEIWDAVIESAMKNENITRVNRPNIDGDGKKISFSVVHDPESTNHEEVKEELAEEIKVLYPDMEIEIYSDIDM